MTYDDDENVGYGKPPKRTRFKKGQSGNPSGRPRKSEEAPALDELLNKKVPMTVDGKTKRVTVEEALAHKAIQGALGDSPSAANERLKILEAKAKRRGVKEAKEGKKHEQFVLIIAKPAPILHPLRWLGILAKVGEDQGMPTYKIAPWAVEAAVKHRGSPLTEREKEWAEKELTWDFSNR